MRFVVRKSKCFFKWLFLSFVNDCHCRFSTVKKHFTRSLLLEWLGFNKQELDESKLSLEIKDHRLTAVAFVATILHCKSHQFLPLIELLDYSKTRVVNDLSDLELKCLETSLAKLPSISNQAMVST